MFGVAATHVGMPESPVRALELEPQLQSPFQLPANMHPGRCQLMAPCHPRGRLGVIPPFANFGLSWELLGTFGGDVPADGDLSVTLSKINTTWITSVIKIVLYTFNLYERKRE